MAGELPRIESQIDERAKMFPRSDSIITLLAMEDALDDTRNEIFSQMMNKTGTFSKEDWTKIAAIFRRVDYLLSTLEFALMTILEKGNQTPRKFDKLPPLFFFLVDADEINSVNHLVKQRFIDSSDEWRARV